MYKEAGVNQHDCLYFYVYCKLNNLFVNTMKNIPKLLHVVVWVLLELYIVE